MRPPQPSELLEARQRAEIFLLVTVLDTLAAVLMLEHPQLDADAHPGEDPEILAARNLLRRADDLKLDLHRYTRALRDAAIRARQQELPF